MTKRLKVSSTTIHPKTVQLIKNHLKILQITTEVVEEQHKPPHNKIKSTETEEETINVNKTHQNVNNNNNNHENSNSNVNKVPEVVPEEIWINV